MSLFAKLQNIEKKYSFTFLGFVLAAIFGLISIYTTFFWDRNPQIRYTVTSILGVYDIYEEVGKLDVIYDGINIREKHQMLSLISLNIANIGRQHLTRALYDNSDPLGFNLKGGILIKAEIIEASNSYLFRNLKISMESKKTAFFSPVIIDSGESFSVKILVLHDESTFPEILPIGKIAGVKELELIPWTSETSKTPFWKEVISGGLLIHLTRIPIYILALILIGIAIGLPTASLSEYATKRKRRKHVSDFKSISDISFTQDDDFIFEIYIRDSEIDLFRIDHLVSSKESLEKAFDYHSKHMEKEHEDTIVRVDFTSRHYPLFILIPQLVDSGFVTKDNDSITINSHMQNTLHQFLRFLKGRGVKFNEAQDFFSEPRIVYLNKEDRYKM